MENILSTKTGHFASCSILEIMEAEDILSVANDHLLISQSFDGNVLKEYGKLSAANALFSLAMRCQELEYDQYQSLALKCEEISEKLIDLEDSLGISKNFQAETNEKFLQLQIKLSELSIRLEELKIADETSSDKESSGTSDKASCEIQDKCCGVQEKDAKPSVDFQFQAIKCSVGLESVCGKGHKKIIEDVRILIEGQKLHPNIFEDIEKFTAKSW